MKQSGMWTLLAARCMSEEEKKGKIVSLGACDGLRRKCDKVLICDDQ